MGEELRLSRAEAAHLPGFRYLYTDASQGVARASPRTKVSAISHHARALAAALRGSLGQAPPLEAGEAQGAGSSSEVGEDGLAQQQQVQPQWQQQDEVLEVLAKSSQECWAAAWRPDGDAPGGRQLLAVRERRGERELQEAAGVMAGFAAEHFLV